MYDNCVGARLRILGDFGAHVTGAPGRGKHLSMYQGLVILLALCTSIPHTWAQTPQRRGKTEATSATVTNTLTKAANGDAIPHPGSTQTYTVNDGGRKVQVPVNMVYIPAGEFMFGGGDQGGPAMRIGPGGGPPRRPGPGGPRQPGGAPGGPEGGGGTTGKLVRLESYCIGKFHVTNAEYKAFLDATGGRAPSYWTNGSYPEGKANHPVAFVSMTQARAYADWVGSQTGWKVTIPTSEQWEKAARGPKNTLYPWGNSMDVTYAGGVLSSKFNYNGVITAEFLRKHPKLETTYSTKAGSYAGQKVTVDTIAAYDESGQATPLTISPTGQVRGWVAHSTNTGFIGTDLFRAISSAGGYTTPVGQYEAGKSGYGCYDMAGNLWTWCDTQITATNGAERGQQVNEIRGGSWYATGTSCKSVSIGEGRAPSGSFNTVGFRIAMILAP